MAAALTIAVLLALSVTLVRVASVAMRLTGLPDNVARFQCVSALTGTGFTTREAEMIVNYPIRRKVLVLLMVAGNLGLVSIAGTFIVALVDTDGGGDALALQGLAMAAAVGITLFVMTNGYLDKTLCGAIGALLTRFTRLGKRPYQRLLQIDEGFSIAEHVFKGADASQRQDLPLEDFGLQLIAVRAPDDHAVKSDADRLAKGDLLLCCGSDSAHDRFGRYWNSG